MSDIDVLERILDSADVTTGGGSAAALAGAMAAGLMGMVARLSAGKDLGFSPDDYLAMADELDRLGRGLLLGAQADSEAYALIKAAYRLPREDKPARDAAIQAAGMQAADVPLANGMACRAVLELGLRLDGRSNPNAGSDLQVGLALARTGIAGCAANVRVNLGLIKDPELKLEYGRRISELERKGEGAW